MYFVKENCNIFLVITYLTIVTAAGCSGNGLGRKKPHHLRQGDGASS